MYHGVRLVSCRERGKPETLAQDSPSLLPITGSGKNTLHQSPFSFSFALKSAFQDQTVLMMLLRTACVSSLFTCLVAFATASSSGYQASGQRNGDSNSLPFGKAPIPLDKIPTKLSLPKVVDSISTETVRNTLALYPFAIDGKAFDALDKVFAEDAEANYSAPLNTLAGLTAIKSVLSASLMNVSTQHSFGTQFIYTLSADSAFSITYYQASHFGHGNLSDQVATAFGQYQDTWKRMLDGNWRILYRNLVYMVGCCSGVSQDSTLIDNRVQSPAIWPSSHDHSIDDKDIVKAC